MKTKRVLSVLNKPMAEPDKTRGRILDAAREQFMRSGFSQTTVDSIASSLGISKATLYKYFSSKDDLLKEIVFGLLAEIEAGVNAIIQDGRKDFVEKLGEILSFIGLKLSGISGLLTLDIQRNAPEIWKEIDEFRSEKILSKLKWVIREGVENGVFRPDFDQDLLVLMYITIIQSIMNPATLVHFSLSFSEGFEMIIRIVLEGILTEKGRAKYSLPALKGRGKTR